MRTTTIIMLSAVSLLIPSSAQSGPVHSSASISIGFSAGVEWYDDMLDEDFVVADRVCRWVILPSGNWSLKWRIISYDEDCERWFYVGPWHFEYSINISRPYWRHIAFSYDCQKFYCNHPNFSEYYIYKNHRRAAPIRVTQYVRYPYQYHDRQYYRDRNWRSGDYTYRYYEPPKQNNQTHYTAPRPAPKSAPKVVREKPLSKAANARPAPAVQRTVERKEPPKITKTVVVKTRPAQEKPQKSREIKRGR